MHILSTILQAIPIALAISVAPGAAFLGIIQTSLNNGFKAGILFALGIAFSDIILIGLCLWGTAGIMHNPTAKLLFSILGGIILIGYGLVTFFNRKRPVKTRHQEEVLNDPRTDRLGKFKYPMQGFAFNITNPFVWILWIGIAPYSGPNINLQILFFACILLTIFCIDMLKSFFAGKLKKAITYEVAFIVNRVVGVVFCALGIFMIVRMLLELYW